MSDGKSPSPTSGDIVSYPEEYANKEEDPTDMRCRFAAREAAKRAMDHNTFREIVEKNYRLKARLDCKEDEVLIRAYIISMRCKDEERSFLKPNSPTEYVVAKCEDDLEGVLLDWAQRWIGKTEAKPVKITRSEETTAPITQNIT